MTKRLTLASRRTHRDRHGSGNTSGKSCPGSIICEKDEHGPGQSRQPGRPRGQSDFLEPEELKRLVGLPDRRTKEGLRDYALLVLLANTPLRKSEICSLRRGSLVERGGQHWIEYEVRKKRRKRKKRREACGVIPIRPEVSEALLKYQRAEFGRGSDRADNPMLMTLGKHGPAEKRGITAKAVDLAVAKYAGRAEIAKRITPHSFRASYATNALTAGTDLKTVSLLLGHASTASTEPYLRSNMERMRRAAEGFCYI